MELQAAFERDLQHWLATIYERLDEIRRFEEHVAVEGVLERENRLLIALMVVLAFSILLLPLAGGTFMIAALVLLYVGALGSSAVTILKIRRLEQSSARQEAIRRRREAAWAEKPPIGPDERAYLVRIMNLSGLRLSDTLRAALAAELAEARRLPILAGWHALEDAAVLVRERPLLPQPES